MKSRLQDKKSQLSKKHGTARRERAFRGLVKSKQPEFSDKKSQLLFVFLYFIFYSMAETSFHRDERVIKNGFNTDIELLLIITDNAD